MSSRNLLLEADKRKSAVLISQTLFQAKENYRKYTTQELKKWVIDSINKDQNLKVEYFEIVNDPDLEELGMWEPDKKMIACIAVFAGNIRLIDNIYFN